MSHEKFFFREQFSRGNIYFRFHLFLRSSSSSAARLKAPSRHFAVSERNQRNERKHIVSDVRIVSDHKHRLVLINWRILKPIDV